MFEFSELPLEIQLKILIRLNFEDQDNFLENLEGYYKEIKNNKIESHFKGPEDSNLTQENNKKEHLEI